jgi:hypothetical protein
MKSAQIAATRAERQTAILNFLAAVQPAERVIEEVAGGAPPDKKGQDELRHSLWATQKPLDLICSEPLARSDP